MNKFTTGAIVAFVVALVVVVVILLAVFVPRKDDQITTTEKPIKIVEPKLTKAQINQAQEMKALAEQNSLPEQHPFASPQVDEVARSAPQPQFPIPPVQIHPDVVQPSPPPPVQIHPDVVQQSLQPTLVQSSQLPPVPIQSDVLPPISIQPVFIPPSQPIQPVFVPPPEPVQPVFIPPSQPIQPVFIPPSQPIQPILVPPPEPIQPILVSPPQPATEIVVNTSPIQNVSQNMLADLRKRAIEIATSNNFSDVNEISASELLTSEINRIVSNKIIGKSSLDKQKIIIEEMRSFQSKIQGRLNDILFELNRIAGSISSEFELLNVTALRKDELNLKLIKPILAKRIMEAENTLRKMNMETKSISSELSARRDEMAEIDKQISALETRINVLRQQLKNPIVSKLGLKNVPSARRELDSKTAQLAPLKEKRAKITDIMNKLLELLNS